MVILRELRGADLIGVYCFTARCSTASWSSAVERAYSRIYDVGTLCSCTANSAGAIQCNGPKTPRSRGLQPLICNSSKTRSGVDILPSGHEGSHLSRRRRADSPEGCQSIIPSCTKESFSRGQREDGSLSDVARLGMSSSSRTSSDVRRVWRELAMQGSRAGGRSS